MADTHALGAGGCLALAAKGGTFIDGTARSLGTGHAIPIESEEIRRIDQKVDDVALVNQTHARAPIRTGMRAEGSVRFPADYNYLSKLLALSMGTAGTPNEDETSVRYTHSLALHASLLGVYASVGINRVIDQAGSGGDDAGMLWAGAKANGFEFTAAQGDHARIAIPFLCRDLTEGVDTTGYTYPHNVNTEMQYVLLSEAVVRINAQSGGALGSGDELDTPVSATISYQPNLLGDVVHNGEIDEPVMRARPVTRLTLSFARYSQTLRTLLLNAFRDETPLKADLVFTGNALGGGNYGLTFRFPFLKIDNDLEPVLSGPDVVPFDVEFHAQEATSAPTGMTGLTAPFEVDLTNSVSADPLATS